MFFVRRPRLGVEFLRVRRFIFVTYFFVFVFRYVAVSFAVRDSPSAFRRT